MRGPRPCSCASRADIAREIWVEKEGEQINGKSIMGLMMLAAGQGSKLMVRCEGPDADRAMEELENLINRRFNED